MKINTSVSVVVRIVLWLGLIIGGSLLSLKIDLQSKEGIFFNPLFHIFSFIVGFVLLRFAFRAAAKGGKELARFGRDNTMPRLETNRLVSTGIYAQMRHPMLFGLMLIPLSVAFLLGSPTFITMVAPLEMIFIALMVLIFEEMECKKKFGKEYEAYAQKVSMVCFGWRCLRELFLCKED